MASTSASASLTDTGLDSEAEAYVDASSIADRSTSTVDADNDDDDEDHLDHQHPFSTPEAFNADGPGDGGVRSGASTWWDEGSERDKGKGKAVQGGGDAEGPVIDRGPGEGGVNGLVSPVAPGSASTSPRERLRSGGETSLDETPTTPRAGAAPVPTPIPIPGATEPEMGPASSSTTSPTSKLSAKLGAAHPADAVSPDHPDPHAEQKRRMKLGKGAVGGDGVNGTSADQLTESTLLASGSRLPTPGVAADGEIKEGPPPSWSMPAGATGRKAVPTMQDAAKWAKGPPPSSPTATATASPSSSSSAAATQPRSQQRKSQQHRPEPLQPMRDPLGLDEAVGVAEQGPHSASAATAAAAAAEEEKTGLEGTEADEELVPPRAPALRRDSSGSGSGFAPVDDSSMATGRASGAETRRSSFAPTTPTVSVAGPPDVPAQQRTTPPQATVPKSATRASSSREPSSVSASQSQTTGGRSRRQLGEYALGKTLGAGSMGKVKLGVSATTGEKIAIKIIPRHTSMAAAQAQANAAAAWGAEKERRLALGLPPVSRSSRNGDATQQNGDGAGAAEGAAAAGGEPKRSGSKSGKDKDKKDEEPLPPTKSFVAKAQAKDVSKEVRTIREASIVLLLHHPYVCGMKSMLVYPHHYYMLFEYVNGGQMLDYIISHGRLRERAARKFARQMGSALEYCHANSIVHRDLKIENILISKTGNIKIIDFGLSNLFSPHSSLSTFCGSLYFAAPELLNAKVYTGPEVDVWSFGIVLYVLVCGKVPFDDQSMPALHAKIKRGQVEYPAWLTSECKHLLSRMLVTNPQNRAALTEVLAHPWVTKGYEGAPSSHLPHREPLIAHELDADVVRGMTGFEFGTPEEIEARLRRVLSSDLYIQVVRLWHAKRGATEVNGAANGVKKESKGDRELPRAGRSPNKRFSGLGFYGKKVAGGLASVLGSTKEQEKAGSETASLVSATDAHLSNGMRVDSLDPTRGFHPLISIYYLVREKIEREKIYGAGVFASSTLSLTGPPPPPAPPSVYRSSLSPMTAEFPTMPSPTLAGAAARTQAPASAPQPRRTGVPLTAPLSPSARQRASADDYGTEDVLGSRPLKGRPAHELGVAASAPTTPSVPSSLFARSDSTRQSSKGTTHRRSMHIPDSATGSPTTADSAGSPAAESDKERPLSSAPGGAFARRFGSLLGRSSSMADSDYKRHRHRSSIGGTGHKAGTKTPVGALPQVDESDQPVDEDVPLALPGKGQGVNRSSTVGSPASARLQHQRGASVGGAATVGRAQGAALSAGGRPRMASLQGGQQQGAATPRESDEDDAAIDAPGVSDAQQKGGRGRSGSSGKMSDKIKPVYLKGLFSVATTSTRNPQAIRDDLVRVLDQIGIQHRDIKGGFECVHQPSIDLSSLGGNNAATSPVQDSGSPGFGFSVRPSPSVKRKSSFARHGTPSSPQPEVLAANQSDASLPPSQMGMQTRTTSSSSFGPLSHSRPANSAPPTTPRPDPISPQPDQGPSGGPNSDMIVRFEIFLVRMPLLPGIHGVQFRRISGNAWQYSLFARRILQELKL